MIRRYDYYAMASFCTAVLAPKGFWKRLWWTMSGQDLRDMEYYERRLQDPETRKRFEALFEKYFGKESASEFLFEKTRMRK